MRVDLSGRSAVVTGGTRGLGLAAGLALGRCGAEVFLTHRWGSADEDAIRAAFAEAGAPAPGIVEADVAHTEDTAALLDRVAARHDAVDVLVSNVCVASTGGALDRLSDRDLTTTLRYSAWPTLAHFEAVEARFSRPPRCLIATSSDGPDHHYPGYDYVAAAKAALEAVCAALAERTAGTEARVFALRSRQAGTESYAQIFGAEARALVARFERFGVSPEEVGGAVVALASGLLDGLHGRVLRVDQGEAFSDNVMTAGPWLLRGEVSS